MSVLACDKKGCENIMCDTCIDGKYYICNNCKEDFKEWLSNLNEPLYLDSLTFIKELFIKFMNEYKEETTTDLDFTLVNEFLKY